MAPLTTVTPEALIAQRQQILDRLGISLDEYLERAEKSELSGEEWEVREDLDGIAFLLGEDRFVD